MLRLGHEFEFVDEVAKVLETRVEVGLGPQSHDSLEVMVVDVSVHAEEALEDDFDHVVEVGGEGGAWRG